MKESWKEEHVMGLLEEKRASQTEWLILLAIWLAFAAVQTLLYPMLAPSSWEMPVDAKSIFEVFYGGFFAFLIAFPLANRQLPKQRYAAFGLQAFALLAASALLLELVIDPVLFGGSPFLAAAWPHMVETGAVALLLTAVRLLFQRQRSERRMAELQRANAEAELQHLKAQINPHVLFNALNNIYSHALQKSERTPTLILKLADILRYMIYECADDEVALEKEVEFLSDYVEIQKLAVEGRGDVTFETRGEISVERIPPFLLIPFVENCFKHSLDTQEENIAITIGLEAANGRLQLDCANSFDPASLTQSGASHSGIGLANVRRRLELLMGDNFSLHAGPRDGVFRVQLNIPVQA